MLQLPDHPLHFQVSSQSSSSSPSARRPPQPAEDEDPYYPNQFPAAHMTVHLLTPQIAASRVGGRTISRTTQSKLKLFFDDLINVTPLPPPSDADPSSEGSTHSTNPPPRKPRIVYVRDFNTLAASAGHWYPALLQSVRQRRVGPIARNTSPVLNPTTIVFGVTPPVVPRLRPSAGGGSGGVQSGINVLTNQRSASSSERERVGGTAKSGGGSAVGRGEWGEDESSERAREKRLKERLKKWEKGERFLLADELPALQFSSSPVDDLPPASRNGAPSPEAGFPGLTVGGSAGPFGPLSSGLPGTLFQGLMGLHDSRPGLGSSQSFSAVDGADGSTSPNNFFRSSVVVPFQRSVPNEKSSRMNRRREINELTVRMALASVGGNLPPLDATSLQSALQQAEVAGVAPAERADLVRMWDAWGRVVVVWSVVKQVVDRALGSVLIPQQEYELHQRPGPQKIPKVTLDPTLVPWSAVARAFLTKASGGAMRKHWAKETAKVGEGEGDAEEGANESGRNGREEALDEEIEKVKQDPTLEEHEQRLLGCIVDPRKSIRDILEVTHRSIAFFCRNFNQYVRTSTPSTTHDRLCSVDRVSPASSPARVQVWYPEGARDYWMSVVWTSRYRENVGGEGVG